MIYKRIRELREDKDLTQAIIGKAINVPQRAYSYYENGERGIPLEVIIELAKFYNTSVDFLLGLTNEKNPYPHIQNKP